MVGADDQEIQLPNTARNVVAMAVKAYYVSEVQLPCQILQIRAQWTIAEHVEPQGRPNRFRSQQRRRLQKQVDTLH